MNTQPTQDLNDEERRLLDLLVDGELDDPRRKQLLLTLDQKPSGWRNCALAFLEAQSWQGSLRAVMSERPAEVPQGQIQTEPVHESQTLVEAPSTSERPWMTRPVGLMAMAASMLVAFGLGIALNRSYAPNLDPGQSSTFVQNEEPAPSFPQAPVMRNMPDAAGENVRLVVDGDEHGSRLMDVPLLDDPDLLESFPFRHQSAIPADVLQQLEQTGHRVEHQRRLAPVELPDGRRLLVPVEDVKIVPIKRQMY